ncbi:MAG TPA: phosphomannomutase [Candidatus Woesebacteria bacterium]|nr:phosphomannomutase [Candidatus Woesebacteria bacterium]
MRFKVKEIKDKTGVGFGTSGVRGLVTDLTDEVVYGYVLGFLTYIGEIKAVAIAGDLRDSTDHLMQVVGKAIKDFGAEIINCGKIPTPAVAFYGIQNKIPAIMVTGSHIPSDRNGIKFYKQNGEILKSDEQNILETEIEIKTNDFLIDLPEIDLTARNIYLDRYKKMFENDCLKGMRVGIYGHSAVGKDILKEILEYLGVETTMFGVSDVFIPVDTEVINPEIFEIGKLNGFKYDALVSTDGDSDRPLLGDETGTWLRSDILGILTAKYLKAEIVVNPISCNTALEKSGFFKQIIKTKIGSPYVVEAMNGEDKVVGYEANGGFFTQDLPTRDAILPLLCWLVLAKDKKISELKNNLPQRFTWSNEVKAIVDEEKILSKVKSLFNIVETNTIDGWRFLLDNGEIIHLRASKNSLGFKNYCEADSENKAIELSDEINNIIKSFIING